MALLLGIVFFVLYKMIKGLVKLSISKSINSIIFIPCLSETTANSWIITSSLLNLRIIIEIIYI